MKVWRTPSCNTLRCCFSRCSCFLMIILNLQVNKRGKVPDIPI
jgi:hypothetical protein